MRFGILDAVAVGLTFVVLVLPENDRVVRPHFKTEQHEQGAVWDIAAAQAEMVARPTSSAAAVALTEALVRAEQTDAALRVSGEASTRVPAEEQAAVLLAVSVVHGTRLDMPHAFEWGERALKACDAFPSTCPDYQRARMEAYVMAVGAGAKSGVDPFLDPGGFEEVMRRALPMIRVQAPRTPPRPAPGSGAAPKN